MRSERLRRVGSWLGEQRIYVLLAVTMLVLSAWAPKFLNHYNLTVIAKSASLNALVAVGFTVVLICGELDLSIGTTITLGAMLAVGLQPSLGWCGSVAVALVTGVGVGVANGLLVTKLRLHSFIATLGSMTMAQGVIYMYSHGSSVSVTGAADLDLGAFLESPLGVDVPFLSLFAPRTLVTVAVVLLVHWGLTCTRPGRNLFLVGGSKETAWLAGLNPDAYVLGAFALSGFTAALGGALVGMGMSSATTDLGTSALMDVISATIIGGTAMSGGRGSVLSSAVAVLTFAAMFNGFNRLGFGSEFRVFVAGLVLAGVVLQEAWARARHERTRGRRSDLLAAWRQGPAAGEGGRR